jgi:hypothetical protein
MSSVIPVNSSSSSIAIYDATEQTWESYLETTARNLVYEAERQLVQNICTGCPGASVCFGPGWNDHCIHPWNGWRAMVADYAIELVKSIEHLSEALKTHIVDWIDREKLWAPNYTSLDDMLAQKVLISSRSGRADFNALRTALPWIKETGIATEEELSDIPVSNLRMIGVPLKRAAEEQDQVLATNLLAEAKGSTWQELRRTLFNRAVPRIVATVSRMGESIVLTMTLSEVQLEMLRRSLRDNMEVIDGHKTES